jgi:uncharacterized protein (TIGR02217 family)
MPAAFHEVRFPLDISLGSRGGPRRRTDIVTLASGREERNARWAHSLRRYDAGLGVRTLDALHAVIAFFEERRGRLYGFRFRDRADQRSCAFADAGADRSAHRLGRRRNGRVPAREELRRRARALRARHREAGRASRCGSISRLRT